jgi:hypothetical protein
VSRLFAAVPAEFGDLYLEFLFLASGKMIVLVLADRAAHYDGNSICHIFPLMLTTLGGPFFAASLS